MRILACIDYDNVKLLKERYPFDVESNVDELLDRVVECIASRYPATEIDARLYGGWMTEERTYSRLAEWALAPISRAKGRRKGIRILPNLITSPACRPSEVLVGTVRTKTPPVRQKMVDALFTVDAIHLSAEDYDAIYLFSDDDDIVPCAISIGTHCINKCTLVRSRMLGAGLNDDVLTRCGVQIKTIR